jgi:sugar phosphate permease
MMATNISGEQQMLRRRWLVWVPAALSCWVVYFHRVGTGVVADNLMRDFAIERASDLGILASIYFYTYALAQVPAGILADYFGPRLTISIALLVSVVGALLFGWTDTLSGLYLGRFLASLGVSLIYVNIVKIHAEWFRAREFGTMSGLIVLVGNAGSLVAATPLAVVVEALGWRSSFYMIAVFSLLMALLCWLLIRNRPTDIGLPSIAAIEGREGCMHSPAVAKPSIGGSLKQVLGNRHTWTPFFASSLIYGVYMTVVGLWGVSYFMQVYGMSRFDASNHLLLMVAGNMLGGPLFGFFSDRFGFRRLPYVGATAFFLAIWLLLTFWNQAKPPEWALYPICLAIGLGVSGITLTVACVKEVNSSHITGMAAGVANSGAFVGAAFLQPLFGWILDQYWQGVVEQGVKIYPAIAYQQAFLLCAAVLAVGLVFVLNIKETYCRNVGDELQTTLSIAKVSRNG